ncbi:MAG: hypothetical protein ACO33A_09420 [Hyphomonas sp.]
MGRIPGDLRMHAVCDISGAIDYRLLKAGVMGQPAHSAQAPFSASGAVYAARVYS